MILLDFTLYLMETLKHWRSLHGLIVMFMFLTTISKGSACEAPSSPQCFRRNTEESMYRCEWSMNMTERDVTFDLYFDGRKFGGIKETWSCINEEQLIQYRPVDIWVEAHVGNSSCTSTRTSVVLVHTVKYEAPQNISISWLNNNLILRWRPAENHPALAEIWFRQRDLPTESWEKRLITTNITDEPLMYQVTVVNLLKNSAYQVQIRHKSNPPIINPLWSDWSQEVIVPAELEEEVYMTTELTKANGTRMVTLILKPVPPAAAVSGVNYSLNDTHSSRGCPCRKMRPIYDIKKNTYTTYVSYSAVNISVFAINRAGYSPPAVIQVPAATAADLKTCDQTLLDKKLKTQTCLEFYKLQDGDSRPENVITLTKRMGEKKRKQIRKKPLRKPQDFIAFDETQSSAVLSWKAIPSVDQRGFLTHYSLCSVKISSQDEPKECCNLSASLIKHHLENLTPGAKYNITLAGVTRVGEGPKATITINTLPENPVNVWWSLGLLFVFFLISIMCTLIFKRIQNKIFPPVPTPVIPEFTSHPAESQEMLEEKEEVDELTLYQLHPEGKSVSEDAEEITDLAGEWDDGTDEDIENVRGDSRMSGGTSDECLNNSSTAQVLRRSTLGEITDLEQVDNEIAMLIFRNGLVFDVKTDSP
ncbi:interleukin-6 receptor subunit beta isoform X2 [Micropterus dolomieu]|uniref:interleukin-6 receptor subunit beta isoform X2 n=1 Tax=Micropterus dolomieu TaxID=147949 RepID=UPI001E8D0C75|nr:interleukin-6 receptor subunit beta isoform X2 [Micropterus dolomieu]